MMAEDSHFNDASDERLVAGSLEGNTACFGVLVRRYWNMAVAIALSKIQDSTRAEDIAQDSFIRAYLHLNTLRDPSRFAGWLCKIVAQESINYTRRYTREMVVSICEIPEPEQLAPAALAANPGLSEKQRQFVRDAIRRLPEKFQTVVLMRFVAGLSTPEIARQMGKRSGTVRVWLHRAYQRLKKDFDPLVKTGDL